MAAFLKWVAAPVASLREACRPLSVAGGLVADLTRSRRELIAENVLLWQQLAVASQHWQWLALSRARLPSPQ
jgi:hypothetical protein